MPRKPKPDFIIVQRYDYVTCKQRVRGRPTCGALVWFMPGELPGMCVNRHPQPQLGKAYLNSA